MDVAQAIIRELVFGVTGLDPATELRKDKPLPLWANISVLCLDGFDFISVVADALTTFYELQLSVQHSRFVETCLKLGLPLNKLKRVLAATRVTLCGGEIRDGRLGLPAS